MKKLNKKITLSINQSTLSLFPKVIESTNRRRYIVIPRSRYSLSLSLEPLWFRKTYRLSWLFLYIVIPNTRLVRWNKICPTWSVKLICLCCSGHCVLINVISTHTRIGGNALTWLGTWDRVSEWFFLSWFVSAWARILAVCELLAVTVWNCRAKCVLWLIVLLYVIKRTWDIVSFKHFPLRWTDLVLRTHLLCLFQTFNNRMCPECVLGNRLSWKKRTLFRFTWHCCAKLWLNRKLNFFVLVLSWTWSFNNIMKFSRIDAKFSLIFRWQNLVWWK